jgi:membrane fusion protein, multidrug efflux system
MASLEDERRRSGPAAEVSRMGFNRTVAIVGLALAAAAAYGLYAPGTVDRLAPSLGQAAHRYHDQLLGGQKQTAAGASRGQQQPGSSGASGGVAPIVVTVVPAKRADFPVVLESLGQVQAYNTVLVRARVDGAIDKIGFQEGQIVKQGDLLAQIDPRPFQAALDQATAKKAQDEATLANAKLDLTRYTTLAKQDFATRQQLDTQNSLVNQLTATIAADVAAIDAARVQLDYTTIRAPISGRAGFRLIDEGNLVNAGQQTGIVSIAQLQPIAVIFTEPQEYVDRINQELAAGAPQVEVLNTDGAKIATGKLTISDNQVDLATGTIRLKAEFANTDNALWPGLAVTTRLQLGVMKDIVVVPADTVQHGAHDLFVYVVGDDNRVAVRPVKVARQNASTAAIADGLKEGERVVTTGEFLLQPGSVVSIDSASGS